MANSVLGSVCSGTGFFENVSIIGDLVATSAQGPKGLSVKGASANLYQNVVTGGSGIQQRSAAGSLPGVEVAAIAPGQTVSKGQGVYDTTGTHELVSRCLSDKSEIALLSAFVESLGPSANLGALKISSEQTTTVNVSSPGAVNVLDLDRLSIGRDATLTLDGGGDPSTVVVLRVDRTVKFANRATLALSGGLTPEHTMIYVRGKRFATSRGEAVGAGAIVSPVAKVTLGGSTFWTGAVVTGGTRVSLGASAYLWHMPFDGF